MLYLQWLMVGIVLVNSVHIYMLLAYTVIGGIL